MTAGQETGGAAAPPAVAGKKSPALERIRAARKEIGKRNTLTLKVPGYEDVLGEGNALLVRYKPVPGNTITKLAERMKKSDDEAAMKIAADIVIKCCDAILLREGFDADPEPLDPTATEPTTFETATLPELLDFEAETAREEVFATFSPDGVQGLAVVAQASAIVKWLEGKVGEIDQELLGK